MRRRKRVTGRFYVFLLILAVIAFLIVRPHLNFGSKEAVIMTANTQYSQMMDCIIIRDEAITTSESTARVEYIATENTLVNEGDTVAYVYTAGYSEGLLQKLEETRSKIQDYHKNTIHILIVMCCIRENSHRRRINDNYICKVPCLFYHILHSA